MSKVEIKGCIKDVELFDDGAGYILVSTNDIEICIDLTEKQIQELSLEKEMKIQVIGKLFKNPGCAGLQVSANNIVLI